MFCWIFWELVAPVTSSQTPPACHYQALAAASCEATMADSLQVMAFNNTEINDMWFCVRQSEKKTGGKMKQLPAAIEHNRTTQADQVFFVLLILTSVLLLCQTRENDARRRKALLLFVWDDVWPLSLATSPAPRITHPLGPNVDKDRKTTTVKQNVKPWMLLLGLFLFYFVIFLHSSE